VPRLTSTFVAGFSSGGFLASHLVDPTSKSRTRWAAVSPHAGHEYSISRTEPLPVAIHHCLTDGAVNVSGCCARPGDGTPTCCCNIQAEQCISTVQLLHRWLEVNQCRGSRTVPGPAASQCTVGVGCAAETSLCLHGGGCYHSQWVHYFPATADVLDFFVRAFTTFRPLGGGTRGVTGSHHNHAHKGAPGQRRRLLW
jgi:poly(3-hydroxybutyrate) depolymerase